MAIIKKFASTVAPITKEAEEFENFGFIVLGKEEAAKFKSCFANCISFKEQTDAVEYKKFYPSVEYTQVLEGFLPQKGKISINLPNQTKRLTLVNTGKSYTLIQNQSEAYVAPEISSLEI